MFATIANIFGYLLNFLYNLLNNYGLSIIIFSILVKLLLLPLTIKQQKTMEKTTKMQDEMKALQFKYKNDPEKLNREMMDLYKSENMSPFSGCLSSIVQLILLISIFYMVRCPLTYMKKIDNEQIRVYEQQLKDDGIAINEGYSEIDIIRELDNLKEKNPDDENLKNINLNMQFCGLDLSKIPQQHLNDWTVYIIPILYIISTFISMKITTSMQNKSNKNADVIDITENEENKVEEKNEMEEAMAQSNKMMSWMMPIMSVSISLVAPLGLALYWLVNNIVMIGERLILDKVIKD